MRTKLYIRVFIIAIIALYGCNKEWLEKKPKNALIVPDEPEEFQALMDHADLMNNNMFGYGEIAADGHYVTELTWSRHVTVAARNAYTWEHNPFSNQANWDLLFLRVFHCNLVLEGLSKLDSSAPYKKEWENIRGQALFNRAIVFYSLAQTFGQPFNKVTAASDMGIPMRFTTDITERSIRYSVQDTYNQVMNDARESVKLLPDTPLLATRAGKAAAYALLARCYLDKEQYDSALITAEKCISIQGDLIDFNLLSGTAPIGETYATPLHNPEIIFFDLMYTQGLSGFLTSGWFADRSLYDQYETNDHRKSRYFKTVAGGHFRFNGNYNSSSSSIFCGIATDEMYLVQAECIARVGDYKKALEVLNTLLRTRYNNSFVPRTADSAFEALSIILKERRKELLLRNIRWADLRRLNKDERFKIEINRTIGGKDYILLPGSHRYSFPIPDDIIAISKMPQTPGW
jgi:starch-binding outer membrane protein, SusD/RagB family